MAIVSKTSNIVADGDDPTAVAPEPRAARGRMVIATGTVSNAVDDLATSKYLLIELPSHVLLHETTFFDIENWGFAQVQIGTFTNPTAFFSVARSATVHKPLAAGDANHGKELWEILGMAENPGGVIGIYAYAPANATAAGSMPFSIRYIDN